MNAFKKGKGKKVQIYVPGRPGTRPVQRSTGTSDKVLAGKMDRLVKRLKKEREWELLDAVREGVRWLPFHGGEPRRLTVGDVFDADAGKQLEEMKERLKSKNLSEYLEGWLNWIRAERREGVGTPDVYWQQVTSLVPGKLDDATGKVIPGTFPATELTKGRVKTWLAGLVKVTVGTRRKYFYALKSFVGYCVDAGALKADPLGGMIAPKKNPPRERWERAETDKRIVDAALPKYRALFAFIKGIGCDVGSAPRAQKGDLNLARRRSDIRGTKTDHRAVHAAEIEAWAIPYLEEYLRTIVGRHTRLFQGLSMKAASKHHTRLCETLGIEDYTLKDSRHSVGVRMRLAGRSFEEIAAQLGTSVHQCVTVYTRYKPEEAAEEAHR